MTAGTSRETTPEGHEGAPRRPALRFGRAWPLLLLAVGACAGGSDDPPPLDRVGPERLNTFFSPAGQAFRSPPGQPYPSAAWFAAADKDRDGRVSQTEFRADAEAFFRSLDTDRDGMVDGFEVAAYEAATPEMTPDIRPLRPGEGMNLSLGRPGRDGGPPDRGPKRRGRGRGGSQQGIPLFSWFGDPQPLTAADTDFNSRITLEEARAAADRRFARLDAAGGGYLVLSALPRTAAQAMLEDGKDKRRNRDASPVPENSNPRAKAP